VSRRQAPTRTAPSGQVGGAVRLRDVRAGYPRRPAVLDGVDLDVPAGEATAVVGGNGSGKTTLLQLVAGLVEPARGAVTGRPAVVAYVPERFPSHQRMPAVAYLRHLGRIRGLTSADADRRARALLERLSLDGDGSTALRYLSKGNAQKVALAQALLVTPGLLVLDEPWSGLDVAAHGVLAELLDEVTGAGCAVLFTDHRLDVVQSRATCLYRLDGGRLAALAPVLASVPAVPEVPARVEVLPAGHGQDAPWASVPGVLAVQVGAAVVLTVEQDRCDEVLLAVLQAGWTVRAVERTPAGPAPMPMPGPGGSPWEP